MPNAATQERVHEILAYDPDTGIFTYRMTRGCIVGGMQAGSLASNGYIKIRLDTRLYYAQRLAWLYVHGRWPDGYIDHINGMPADNRICNLRDVSLSVNQQNQRKPNRRNTSGFMGVTRYRQTNRWQAKIKVNGYAKHLGFFGTPEEAHEAYLKAKRQLHAGCTI